MEFKLEIEAPLPPDAVSAASMMAGVAAVVAGGDTATFVVTDQSALVSAISRFHALDVAIRSVTRVRAGELAP